MEQEREPEDRDVPSPVIEDIIAIIQSAKARNGRGTLERHITKALPEATRAEVLEAVEVALEVIESIPILLARARLEAETRGLEGVIAPLLDRAERYYIQPLDLIPEMTQGLVGLLDDTYLVLRTLQNLDRGPEPFLDWDLEYPQRFLRRLIGAPIAQRLDDIAHKAMEKLSASLAEAWNRNARQA